MSYEGIRGVSVFGCLYLYLGVCICICICVYIWVFVFIFGYLAGIACLLYPVIVFSLAETHALCHVV